MKPSKIYRLITAVIAVNIWATGTFTNWWE